MREPRWEILEKGFCSGCAEVCKKIVGCYDPFGENCDYFCKACLIEMLEFIEQKEEK